MNNKETNLQRRGFLLAAGVGSVGALAAVASAGRGQAVAKPLPATTQQTGAAYTETRHISNYYRTARV